MTTVRYRDPISHAPIMRQLSTEWHCIRIRSSSLAAAQRWSLPGDEVRSLDDILFRTGYEVPSDDASARTPAARRTYDPAVTDAWDQYLLTLLAIARDDQLAGRVVLQRILPALCAVARRRTSSPAHQAALLDDLVSNAWEVIQSYPVERRTRRVVSNIVRDIGFQTMVRPARRHAATEVPTKVGQLDVVEHIDAVEPVDELIELLDQARRSGCLEAGDIDLICQLVRHGRPENLALVMDVTPRTIRNRRDSIVHRLRSMAEMARITEMAA